MKTNPYIPNHTLTKTDQGYVVNFIVKQNKPIPVFENMNRTGFVGDFFI